MYRAVTVVIFLNLVAVVAGCGDNRDSAIDASVCTPIDDGNECTEDTCEGDQPVNRNRDAGASCSAGVCDGAGACVECVVDDDCTGGDVCDEASNACVPPTCTDGEQNGDETDVDCGGSCAPMRRCDDGDGCGVGGDCTSGVCGAGDVCAAPRCGDGVAQSGEACDDGNDTNGDGCDDGAGDACRATGCGNGIVTAPEVCDDNNDTSGDGCDNNCRPTGCGNGFVTTGETCDDGDMDPGDGCSATCQTEAGYTCDTMNPSTCVGTCGDGVVVTGEACDDAPPAENGDGCSITCTIEPGFDCSGSPSTCAAVCGDGFRASTEGCDDGNTDGGDGCRATCFVEPGWVCAGTPSSCFPICGDNQVVPTEQCDDPLPLENGDGCSASCRLEQGWTCTGSPSSCAPVCGDGLVRPGEGCDDGNNDPLDGCSATCTVEDGWSCAGSPSMCTSTCGDGIPVGTEACDDPAPAEDGDGCSAACTVETGYDCSGSPSLCRGVCGDNMVVPGEPCDDPAPSEDGDGCSATCAVELGWTCSGSPSTCFQTCGNDVIDPGESCDDGGLVSGDGCSAACDVESGWTCSGEPSTCATTCGDGAIGAPVEQCDDMDATGGDGCSATCQLESGWTCIGEPSACATTCGDGIAAGAETCDDGCNAGMPGVCEPGIDDNDGCSSACVNECGDGVLNVAVEQCDDGGRVAGDRCSPTCEIEVTCAPGETAVTFTNRTAIDLPDGNTTGVQSPVGVPHTARVSKAVVFISSLTHEFDDDVDMFLIGPTGVQRELATDIGSSGTDYLQTYFDDDAPAVIPDLASAAPFTGWFRPEQSLSTTAGTDFVGLRAGGTWNLRVADDGSTDLGTLHAWTLGLCINAAVAHCGDSMIGPGEECDDGNTVDSDACSNTCQLVEGCGDGNIDSGEQCDDDNLVDGDGCSATCQLAIACGPGELAVIQTNSASVSIPDPPSSIDSPVTVAPAGAVRKALVYISSITHTNDDDIDMFLVGPTGLRRELATDIGSTGDNFLNTMFDDTADEVIPDLSSRAPFNGRFRPEQSLSAVRTVDFLGFNAAGTWSINIADDLANTNSGTLDRWSLLLCVDPTGYCGDGVPNPGEECDDGNTVDNDACTNSCAITDGCGDGNLDSGEECDDNNIVSGDGCSATCVFDISCAAGQTAVVVRNTTSMPIPDDNSGDRSALSLINVPTAGAVRKVHAMVNISHEFLGDVDVFLSPPFGLERTLTDDNSGTTYTATVFSDDGVTLVSASGQAPYTGTFRPEQSISDAASGFPGQWAQGNWSLRATDDAAGDIGTLDGWALALCVDTSVTAPVCGNGWVEPGETCDDDNLSGGDGCDACQVEIACPVGSNAVFANALNRPALLDDNLPTMPIASTVNVGAGGAVTRAVVVVGAISHANFSNIDMSLVSPGGTTLDISSDNGSTGDHMASSIFDDNAATAATSMPTATNPPRRGWFRPEQPLSGLNGQGASGAWTLQVADDASTDAGLFGGWILGLCVQ